jgi:hypothetical protein
MTKQKPRERLEKTLARVAREQGIDQERLRRWVSFLALCGALDRAIQIGILAGYYLKGGVAMELRFAENARATKDLDVGMEGARADRLRSLTGALAVGFDEFTFRIKAQTRDMEQADTIRVQVAIQYRACTGPAAAGRARDVLDILLIHALGHLDYAAAADAARRVFAERATHAFPPAFVMPPEWGPELEAMAQELGFALNSAVEIEQRFVELIRMLAEPPAFAS